LDLLEDSESDSEPIRDTIHFPELSKESSLEESPSNMIERFLQDQTNREQSSLDVDDAVGASSTELSRELLLRRTRNPSVPFPVSTVRHPRDENFYARDDCLEHIHEKLSHGVLTCVIHGVGGVGKTLLAVEYVRRYGSHYDCTFWVQADTEPGLTESLCMIATELGMLDGTEEPSEAVEIAREWLETTGKRSAIMAGVTLKEVQMHVGSQLWTMWSTTIQFSIFYPCKLAGQEVP
jgi:hypothetical protein